MSLPALTSMAAGAGCGCKLPASEVLPLVLQLPRAADPDVLVGTATGDDAAIVRLTDDLALVQTIDVFTPPVDDPYDFGRIAAANALSDVYAMGGTPKSALNFVGFPRDRLADGGEEVLGQILQGGIDVLQQAGASLVGGHSIDDPEPKYGLAVTGLVHPERYLSNAGGRPGDVLVLTKPLGVGAVMAGYRKGAVDDRALAGAVELMTTLNSEASRAAVQAGAHAMTDVTGFGLLGHLHNLARESGCAAELDTQALPALDGVQALLDGEDAPGLNGGSRRNADWAERFAQAAPDAAPEPWRLRLAADAQTSGGLLVAIPADRWGDVPGARIGTLVRGEAGTIALR